MTKEICVITGSNVGLGYETAKVLSQRPYHIVITSRTLSKSQDSIVELKTHASGASFSAYELDVASPAPVSAFAEDLRKEFSHIDVLINNAGLALDRLVPQEITPVALAKRAETSSQILNTNVVGPNILTTVLLPLLL